MLFVQKKSGRGFLPGWWLILGVSCLLATLAAAADYPSLPLRGRSSALLAALFHHDALGESNRRTALPADAGGGQFFTSASPVKVATAAERAKVVDFANSLVYEGGFFPSEIYDLLGIDNATTSRVARLTRQLDRAEKRSPAPWEVAGRISRSGLAGSSDNWSMSPGELGEEGLSSPGTLAYLPVLALAYAAYPEDGLEAAEQLAILKDDDLRAAAAARGAAGLLMRILVAERSSKDVWLCQAAADSGDPDTERDIRAVRVKDWRYLRGEECAMGRLERVIQIWYQGTNYRDTMENGGKNLRSREGLSYLAALAAATYGMESLPDRVAAAASADSGLMEMVNDLYDLATSEAVLRVLPSEE